MTVIVTFQSSSNFDESSAQFNGVHLLTIECGQTDFDWGALGLVPIGGEDALYVAEITHPLTNEEGVNCGTGWIISIPEDQREQAFEVWPQLAAVEGCTFSRVYTAAYDEGYKQAEQDEAKRKQSLLSSGPSDD